MIKKILIGIALLFLFYLLNWNSVAAPFERDEGEYAYSASLLLDGQLPYQNSFLQKPPMIVYTYALGQLISPNAVWPPRMLAIIFSLGTILLVGLVAKKQWGPNTRWVAAATYLVMSMFPVLTPFAANTEKFMLLPLLALLTLFVYFPQKTPTKVWLFSGALSTIAIMYKPIALPVVVIIYGWWGWEQLHGGSSVKQLFKPLGLTSIGAFATFSLIFGYIIGRGAWADFWQQVVVFNAAYAQSFGWGISNFAYYSGKFIQYWWITFIPTVWFFFARPARWIFYLTLLLVSLLTVYTSPIGHYYLLVIPFASLILAAGINAFANEFTRYQPQSVLIVTTTITIILMIFPFRAQFTLTPTELTNWVYGTVNPFAEAAEVADHVSQITNNNDKIFVAGSEPEIYFYAKRRSVTPFIITYPLNLPTNYREQFQQDTIDDLSQNPPTIIVVSNRAMSGLWDEKSPRIFIDYLNNLVAEKYQAHGGYVWDEYGGSWKDDLTETDIKTSSYIIYKKNSD